MLQALWSQQEVMQMCRNSSAKRRRRSPSPSAKGTRGEGARATDAWCAAVLEVSGIMHLYIYHYVCKGFVSRGAVLATITAALADTVLSALTTSPTHPRVDVYAQVVGCSVELSSLNKPYCLRKGLCPSCMKVRFQQQ
jgi:hypothetical protein